MIMALFKTPGPLNGIAPMRTLRSLNGFTVRQSDGDDVFGETMHSRQAMSYKAVQATQEPSMSDKAMEGMCFDPSGNAFVKHVLSLRDDAVALAKDRQKELERWDTAAKQRTKNWFDADDDTTRDYLLTGVKSAIVVLNGLSAKNFLLDTEENVKSAGCRSNGNSDAKAAVCKADTIEYRIFISLGYCALHKDGRIFGSREFTSNESQLQTLVHEVTHFNTVFGSSDTYYGITNAMAQSKKPGVLKNADSLASFILGIPYTSLESRIGKP